MKMMKKMRTRQAISEVVGVFLLLGITISLFSFLNYIVFSFSFDSSAPSVNLIGSIDKANNTINIQHSGGESLDGNISIVVTVGSHTYQRTAKEILLDTNSDNKWDFGETVRFTSPEIIIDKYVRVTVVDPEVNSILLTVVLQQETG